MRWIGSRVVSVLDSGAEGPWVQIAVATLSGNSLRQTVHTHRAPVHRAAKLVAALLRVAGVTAGLAESNGRLNNRAHTHAQMDGQPENIMHPDIGRAEDFYIIVKRTPTKNRVDYTQSGKSQKTNTPVNRYNVNNTH